MIRPGLAAAVLTGPWSAQPVELRCAHHFGWLIASSQLRDFTAALLRRWPDRPGDAELAAFVAKWPEITDEPALSPPPLPAAPPPYSSPRLHRPMVAITTRSELARLLWLTESELDWFADLQLRNRRVPSGPLRHYRYRSLPEQRGKIRLLEIPKPRLREIQRRLLAHFVGAIPLHPAAHGAVPGRSVRTCVEAHSGRQVLVRCDLESFFASITRPRVRGLFDSIGLDDSGTAVVLAGLATAAVPSQVLRSLPRPVRPGSIDAHRRGRHRLAAPHLPQGAPTSPGIANALAYSLDHRLSLLAEAVGARYTRYVDDLLFSGDEDLAVGALLAGVRDIARAEGFRLAERKTAVLRSSRRQAVLGTVLNVKPSIDRRELDRLRAVLHNCAVQGVASQAGGRPVPEFRERLAGQLAWVGSISTEKGQRLRREFQELDWSSG